MLKNILFYFLGMNIMYEIFFKKLIRKISQMKKIYNNLLEHVNN